MQATHVKADRSDWLLMRITTLRMWRIIREKYLAVLDALNVCGKQAIALEDSPNGVRAAQRAGIFCVAIPNLVTSQLPLEHADMRLASLDEMPLEQLLAKVEEKVIS